MNMKEKNELKFEKVSYDEWHRAYISIMSNIIPMPTDDAINDIYRNIILPKQQTTGAAGMDFYCPFDVHILPHQNQVIPTGIRWKAIGDFYKDTALLIFPRSSLGFKYGIHLINTIGVIDTDYYNANNEGHIIISLYNPSNETVEIKKGDRFVQGIVIDIMICEGAEADKDNIRIGGFGSTNKE